MKHSVSLLVLTASLGLLAACGESKGDRAASGALIGGGAGAVLGGTDGALIGAAGGAAAGALTDKDDVNLGEPFWR